MPSRTISSIVLNLSHGYETKEGDDPCINTAEQALNQLSILFRPQTFLVDAIPILRFVPSWFPGAGFKNLAKAWRKTLDDMTYVPWEYLLKRIVSKRIPSKPKYNAYCFHLAGEWHKSSQLQLRTSGNREI